MRSVRITRLHATGAIAVLFLVASFGSARAAAGEAFIVKDGRAEAEIVTARQPPPIVKLAAAELQSYVERISEAHLPISTTPGSAGSIRIYVGKSPETDRLGVTAAGLQYGAYRVVSGKNWLALLGEDTRFAPNALRRLAGFNPHTKEHAQLTEQWHQWTGEDWGVPFSQLWKQYDRELGIWEQDGRGTFNVVCDFLRAQGVRWYLPGPLGEVVPKKRDIRLPQIDKTVRPDFALRYPYQYGERFAGASHDEVMWQLHMGFDEAPGLFGAEEIPHGMEDVLADPELKAQHPEYYLLWRGHRLTDDRFVRCGKPCLSSSGLFAQNVKYVRAMYDLFDAPMVSVMPPDAYVYPCECDLCKGKATPDRGPQGLLSDYVWSYVDRVARTVCKAYPDRKVICCAYNSYVLPPAKIAELSPNIVVGICQHRSTFQQNPAARESAEALRREWLAKLPRGGSHLCEYEYYRDAVPGSSYQFMPTFYPHAIARDLHSLRDVSLGEFVEVYRGANDGMAVTLLNLYITGRFWWNADQNVDTLLDEYYTLFYGPARDQMKAFIEYSEANWMAMATDPQKIDRAFALLDAAQKRVASDSVYAKRIALIVDYNSADGRLAAAPVSAPRERAPRHAVVAAASRDQGRRQSRRGCVAPRA